MADNSRRYPEEFMRVAIEAYGGVPSAPIPCKDERSTYSLLHRFNRFRNLLVDEGSPYGLASKDLIARRELVGDCWYITFQPSGLYEAKVFASPEKVQTQMNELLAMTKQPEISDDMDKLLAQYGMGRSGKVEKDAEAESVSVQRTVSESSCLHEWNLGRCLKCGVPE